MCVVQHIPAFWCVLMQSLPNWHHDITSQKSIGKVGGLHTVTVAQWALVHSVDLFSPVSQRLSCQPGAQRPALSRLAGASLVLVSKTPVQGIQNTHARACGSRGAGGRCHCTMTRARYHGSPDLWVQATCHARHEHAAPTQGLLEPPATDASGPVASIRQSPRRGRGGGLERACPLWAAVVARRPNRKRAPTARRSGQRPCTAR